MRVVPGKPAIRLQSLSRSLQPRTLLRRELIRIHYVERGSAVVGVLGGSSRGDPGDFMLAINRSPVVRIEYTQDFSMLSVFVPIPEGQRFTETVGESRKS